MSKSYKIILGGLLIIIALSIFMEANRPMPLNWMPNYSKKASTPLGAKAINLYFENLIETKKHIQEIHKPTFEAFQNNEINDAASLLFFNNYLDLDEETTDQLLNWVDNGNTVYISAINFPSSLKDTLNLNTKRFNFQYQFNYESELALTNPNLSKQVFPSATDYNIYYFSELDTLNQRVLGYAKPISENDIEPDKNKKLVNFIEAPFGEGKFYLHSFTPAFGNHFFVNETNYEYTLASLQYINWENPVYIDQYYKTGREQVDSLLYYVIQNKALKWAYYTCIFAALLFVFIQGKRKQKPIPIREPLANKTYEFTKTVAHMFLEENANKDIATKQIKLLLHYIRKQYGLSTKTINEKFYKELAAKTGLSFNLVQQTFLHIQYIEEQSSISKDELLKFNEFVQKIKN
ncbi:DUF4350 domain-containing protein [Psychroflexus salis]|uniref:DUF4350 domain-containing protein n=1 Tax=Psychroflexus salis TaxID=1526574 RepID=A0A917EBB6_9FLAO|nr:DUF4350 domain-containing protein [Psychroflexus salis]GGE19765.1 hypothetical protein GCM10010831_21120 [Psychroflexus salis]